MNRYIRRFGSVGVAMVGACAVLACSGVASAQRLPDPPPPVQRVEIEKAENLPEFIDAYRRSGNPRLLIYTDLVTSEGGTGKRFNDAGTVTRLGARLEDLFRDPEIAIVNSEAMGVLTQQQVEALRRNEEFSAARMLGDAAKADVVMYVRLIEQANRADGSAYTASYVLADLRRGTTLGRYSWDMTPDGGSGEFDSLRMAEYARAIARRVSRQYIEAFPKDGALGGMRRFTIRLIGEYEDDDLVGFRDILSGMESVKPGSVMLRSEDQSSVTGMSTFELFFGGDLLDLRRATRASVDQMNMDADIIDSREGVIDMRLSPPRLSERERMLTGDAENGRNREERGRLAGAYAAAGSPTIAVMINKAAVEVEESLATKDQPNGEAPVQAGDGVNIILGDRVDIGQNGLNSGFLERVVDRELNDRRAERREDAAIDMRVFEDKLAERMLRMGLQPRDISAAQAELLKDEAMRARAWNDRELAYTLGKQSGADIVISGVGRLVRERGSGSPMRVVVTLRAYEVGTSNVVGAASVQRSLSNGLESFNNAVDGLAAEATGRLIGQMSEKWAKVAPEEK